MFALLPQLLERPGTSASGSITGLYAVLVDGDDMNEPIADAVRSILYGHVGLTRSLAHSGHYPAIDVVQSVSRLIGEIASPEVRDAGTRLRTALAAYRENEDLIAIGAYESGTDPVLDSAIALRGRIDAFLRQRVDEPSTAEEADAMLLALADELGRRLPVAGEVLDGPPAAPASVPGRQVPAGGVAGSPVAIPSLQLTA